MTPDLPVVEPPTEVESDTADERTEKTVAGVVLAAGTSSRYGTANKLLATVEGAPLVEHAARTLLAADLDPVVVVTGHEADAVRAACSGLDVEFVHNESYDAGQSTSVRRGIAAVAERGADAVVVALGDMPFVSPASVRALVTAYRAGAGDALAAAHEGTRGNPVLFDATHFPALCGVEGDVGGREILLEGDRSALVAVEDPGVRRDVDRPEDLSSVTDPESASTEGSDESDGRE